MIRRSDNAAANVIFTRVGTPGSSGSPAPPAWGASGPPRRSGATRRSPRATRRASSCTSTRCSRRATAPTGCAAAHGRAIAALGHRQARAAVLARLLQGRLGLGHGRRRPPGGAAERGDERVAVAVLTAANGSHAAGKQTLEGVFRRLLRGPGLESPHSRPGGGSRMRSGCAMVVAIGALAAPAAADAHAVRIDVLSSRPDQVSGGDALVRVAAPRGLLAQRLRVERNGADVTARSRSRRRRSSASSTGCARARNTIAEHSAPRASPTSRCATTRSAGRSSPGRSSTRSCAAPSRPGLARPADRGQPGRAGHARARDADGTTPVAAGAATAPRHRRRLPLPRHRRAVQADARRTARGRPT